MKSGDEAYQNTLWIAKRMLDEISNTLSLMAISRELLSY